jgi:uncharacterized membrane protein YeaQ/YmgE (transglycosylase-associated protein family)
MTLEPPEREEEKTQEYPQKPENLEKTIRSVGFGIVGAICFAMISIVLTIAVNTQQTNWSATCAIAFVGAIIIIAIAWAINW